MDKAAEWLLGNAIMSGFLKECIPPTREQAAVIAIAQLKERGFVVVPEFSVNGEGRKVKTVNGGAAITVKAVLEAFDKLSPK